MEREPKEENENKKAVHVDKLTGMATRVVYWIFQILIFGTMIASVVQLCVVDSLIKRSTQLNHIVLCAVALLLYNIPTVAQRRFKLYVPSALHIFILIFIFAHFILGEIVGVYTTSAVFDKILHATSGLAIAASGFSVVNLLNSNSNSTFKLNPFFVAFFSFCFALAIALLWEIFEFAADSLFGMNMQRWDPPKDLAQAIPPKQGYGLIDTMGDVIVSTVAALVVCVAGYVILKRKQELLNRFLIRKISDYDTAIAEAEEAGDRKLADALRKAKADALSQIETSETHERLLAEEDSPDQSVDNTALDSQADLPEEVSETAEAEAATDTSEQSEPIE